MSKIIFEDKSYIELSKNQSGKVVITIAARENKDSLSIIASSVELSIEQFNKLMSDGR